MGETLFAYGTLQPGLAPTAMRDLVERFRPVGRATVRGKLYHLGAYPGLILEPDAGLVHGQVLEMPDEPLLWRRLDSYEGFAPDAPERSLFRRVRCSARRADGTEVQCWTYVYNGDVRRAATIPSGAWYPDRATDLAPQPEAALASSPR